MLLFLWFKFSSWYSDSFDCLWSLNDIIVTFCELAIQEYVWVRFVELAFCAQMDTFMSARWPRSVNRKIIMKYGLPMVTNIVWFLYGLCM